MKSRNGFTLIELLVVIAIISVLSSIALSSLNASRAKAYDSKRVSDMREIQKALESYYSDFGAYPIPNAHADLGWGTSWSSQCPAGGGWAQDQVIPGLVPKYIASFPQDPEQGKGNANWCCYLYLSNGKDYKLITPHFCPTANYSRYKSILDPRRDGGSCPTGAEPGCWTIDADGSTAWGWAVSTDAAAGW